MCSSDLLDWQVNAPDHMTVGQRHDAINRLHYRIVDLMTTAAWAVPDWATLDKSLKKALPVLAIEESTPELTLVVSDVGLEINPFATAEYVYSTPQRALSAFMTSWFQKNTAVMEAVCVPVESQVDQVEAQIQRDALLKPFIETPLLVWNILADPKVSVDENTATISMEWVQPSWEYAKTVVAHLQRIDGNWYVLPESLLE